MGSYLTDFFLTARFWVLRCADGDRWFRDAPSADRAGIWNALFGRALPIARGLIVGGLTGFLGVGGRFLIVPALILFAALPAQKAAGTSLAIITVSAAAGVFRQLRKTLVDCSWRRVCWPRRFRMFGGFAAAGKVPSRKLQRAYVLFIVILDLMVGALTVIGTSLPCGR